MESPWKRPCADAKSVRLSSQVNGRIDNLKTPGPKPSAGPQAEYYRYAYDRNPFRVFTEGQWLTHAKALFPAQERAGEVGPYLRASWAWEEHLEAATIIPAGMEEMFPPMPPRAVPLPQGTPIGCPRCLRIHETDKYGWVFPSINCHAVYNIYRGWE